MKIENKKTAPRGGSAHVWLVDRGSGRVHHRMYRVKANFLLFFLTQCGFASAIAIALGTVSFIHISIVNYTMYFLPFKFISNSFPPLTFL